MSTVSELSRKQTAEKQKEYADVLVELNNEALELEKEIEKSEDKEYIKRVKLAFISLKQASYNYAINAVSNALISVKVEAALNNARKFIIKTIAVLESVYGDSRHESDGLTHNSEIHEELEESFNDKWRYKFICTLGYMIDYLKYFYGDNSKWKWNFVEIDGRFALLTKNMLNFKSYIKLLDPTYDGYAERSKHMNLVKRLLDKSSKEYRERYELKDKNPDDMYFAITLSEALQNICGSLGEKEKYTEQKRICDLWTKKLYGDLEEKKKNKK